MTHPHRRNKAAAQLILLWAVVILIVVGSASVNSRATAQSADTLTYHPLFDLHSAVFVHNPSLTAQLVTARVYPPSGSSPVSTASSTIPGQGTWKIDASAFPGLTTGSYSLVISSPPSVQSAVLLNQATGSGDTMAAYSGSLGSKSAYFGVFYSTVGGIDSKLEVVNSGVGQDITLQFYSLAGAPKKAVAIPFKANEERTINGLEIGAIAGDQGWVEATAANPFAGVLVQTGGGYYRVEDPIPMVANGSSPRLFKEFVEGGGPRSSRMILLNPSGAGVNGSITLMDGAAAVADPVPYSLAAHQLKFLDLGTLASLPGGKVYSAQISGGLVAISEETVYAGSANPAATFSLPATTAPAFQVAGILRSPSAYSVVSLQNAGAQPAPLTLAFIRADGTVGMSLPPATLAGGQTLRLDANASAELGTSFEGSLSVSSTIAQTLSFQVDQYRAFRSYLPVVGNRTNFCGNPQDYLAERYYSMYQWDMDAIHANTAWAQCLRGNTDMVVATIDSGVDLDHPDLVANLLPGYDFVDEDSVPEDGKGHGTHVAGTIAAAINQQGIVGLAPNVKILPARVLDNSGSGNTSNMAEAIRWAADRARILNISAGGPSMDSTLQSALDYAINTKGRLVIAAAGNSRDELDVVNRNVPLYPGAYLPVFAVAATDIGNTYAFFSNHNNYVDIAAPGVAILSDYLNGGYAFMDGTSMAAPHVSALAALVWSQNPEYTAAQVIAAIETTALDAGVPGWDADYGCGVIQVDSALGIVPPRSSTVNPCKRTFPQSVEPKQGVQPQAENRSARIVPGRVLVKLREGIEISGLPAGLSGLQVERELEGLQVQVLRVPAGQEWQVIDQLRSLPEVVYAEPDTIVEMQ